MKIWVDAFITSGSVSKTLDMMLEAFMESLILISALHTEMQIAYSTYFQPCCIPLLMRGNYSTKTIYFLLSTKKRFTLLVCSADDAKGPYPSNFSILQTNTVYFQYSFQVPWCFAGSRFWKISFYHTFWIFHCNSFYLKVISKSLISFTFQSELRYGKSREFICKVASIH